MPFNIGAPELIIILIIALVVIGPGRLPSVGEALGKSIREFRKASTDISEAARIDTSPLPPSAAPAPTPQLPSAAPTASTVPAPIVTPPTTPSDDESTNLPA
jgi:sec-independent protein translocase protein TatA